LRVATERSEQHGADEYVGLLVALADKYGVDLVDESVQSPAVAA
jgi:hypothetical protein